MLKKTNKKGFTLIELIIVIAIMAILIALLAPQLIKYIEKSKVSKDKSALDAVRTAIEAEMMDEELSKYKTGELVGGKIPGKALKDLGADDAMYKALFDETNPVLADKYVDDDAKLFTSSACEGAEVYIFVKANGGVGVAAVKDGAIVDGFFVSSSLDVDDVTVSGTVNNDNQGGTNGETNDEGTN